ncbi:hypothetical protein ACOSQ3_024207 [Xanthoceras sorbifolium]
MIQDDVMMFGGFFFEQIHPINHLHTLDQPHKEPSKRWSMVTIRDSLHSYSNSDCSIFPPINHENLHIQEQHKHQNPSSNSSSPLSLSPLSDLNTQALPSSSKEVISGWLDFGLEALRAKIFSLFGNNGAIRRVFGSFGSAAGVAVLVMLWWLCRRIRRRRSQRECVEYLKLIIKQKDEKITQLLHQIVQMNEVLVAHHKVLTSKLPN